MSSYFALGSTGLCGNFFVNIAANSANVARIYTVSRREPKVTTDSSKLVATVEPDTEKWPALIKNLEIPEHSTYYSSFGTTRKAAGGAENFIKIDEGINVAAATAAKESGKFDTAVLVSSIGANSSSHFLYMATKGRIEEKIKELKFKRTIILRPGLLLGEREHAHSLFESASRKVGGFLRGTMLEGLFAHPIQGEEVAKVAFYLSQQPIEKDNEVLVVDSKEMLKIVRDNGL
ncbi:hypothetical protein KL930_003117 [Ogataea haglerorum]|uniref:NAD(P)-binding domain-containing protein n=1 Tax=Ogataea haglerorum TaxID=1937702 RepID=A0ABQ7RHM8_9ASCO|nr:uncharacterized protein KL911_002628 [Ogataea haglerorum]KAG7696091.1 hypothetical protein KL915_002455 [Ogataea haglerorum]KAG7696462.1 hypothetical protein KL951_002918 [Ogataea haglerorum]KAG7707093.1 hypothetical protein KL914_002977 [Ogataea haglerorum]KAG7708600.1 hypothetical protein KL950_002120 [Ogataea haglerorum]KAG7713770.1 hypothetical protein KL913_004794 [Ogataea haglerorum]